MDKLPPEFKEVDMREASDEAVMEFIRCLCTFTVDINTKDPLLKEWIYKNKHLIKTGKE